MNQNKKQYIKIVINISIAILFLFLFIFVLPRLLVFFMPFVVGWIISLIANPPVKFLEEKLRIKRKAISAFVIITVLIAVIVVGYVIIAKLIQQSIGFMESLPELWKTLEIDLSKVGKSWDVFFKGLPIGAQDAFININTNMSNTIGNIIEGLGSPTMAAIGNFAKNIPSFLISFIMCVLSAYFFVAEKENISKAVKSRMSVSLRSKWEIGTSSMKQAIGGYFLAQFRIEIWIYMLVVIGLLILKVEYAYLIAVGIACLDLLPFFGTGTIMVPWAILKFISADYKSGFGLLIIWSVGQLVRQFIQPKIVGDSLGMKPIPTLFLLYIGYKFGSVVGMIMAIPIGIIIGNFNKAGVFDTTKNSFYLLFKKVNDFRRLDEKDLEYLHLDEKKELEESAKK